MVENSMLNDIGTWCSIIGLGISLVTLWFGYSIKKAVKKAETKALFNTMSPELLNRLKKLNSELVSLISSNDDQDIKNVLNRIKTQLVILSKYIPYDYKDKCSKIIIKIEDQYKSIIIFGKTTDGVQLNFSKNKIYIEDLWDTYNYINEIIDYLENYQHEKNILL